MISIGEAVETGHNLQIQILSLAEDVAQSIKERSDVYSENRHYLPTGTKDPIAMLEIETDLIDQLPSTENGKTTTQAQKERLLKQAKINSPRYHAAFTTSQSLQKRISKMDGDLDAKQTRLRAATAALGYFTATIRAITAQEADW